MFDTSVVRSRSIAAPRHFSLLAASLAAHSGAVVAAVALTIASTQLPTRAPGQMELYRPVVLPALPPAYGHPPRPKADTVAATPVKTPPSQVTAPGSIPSETPAVTGPGGPAPAAGDSTVLDDGSSGPIGVPWGDPNSVAPIDVTAQPAPPKPVDVYRPGGEVRSARVLSRVEPRYPAVMVTSGMAAVVTVRCVIDKSGRIRDPEIVQSSFPPFNASVLDAVRQWTFIPGTRRGETVDTYFELTVRFVVQR